MYTCTDDQYDNNDGNRYDDVDHFLDMCSDVHDAVPELYHNGITGDYCDTETGDAVLRVASLVEWEDTHSADTHIVWDESGTQVGFNCDTAKEAAIDYIDCVTWNCEENADSGEVTFNISTASKEDVYQTAPDNPSDLFGACQEVAESHSIVLTWDHTTGVRSVAHA